MNSMVEEAEPLFRDELKTRLEAIAEKDSSLVALFAGRCALRAMPFLVKNTSFNCWPEVDQAHHLLAVWFAATLGFAQSNDPPHPYANVAYTAATATSTHHDAASAAYAATNAYAAAANATNAADSADAAAAAADDAYTAISTYTVYLSASMRNDLVILESKKPMRLFTSPLWQEPPQSSEYHEKMEDWSRALSQLAKTERSRNHALADLIAELPMHYIAILEGHYSLERAAAVTERLFEYFAKGKKLPKRTKANTKAQKGEEDKATNGQEDQPQAPIYDYNPSLTQSTEHPSSEDHLGRESIYTALAAILADPNNKGHQTIGLLGEWGAGKSSWIKLLEKSLKSHEQTQPYLISTFNAWAYEHTPNLQAGIAHEVIKTFVTPPKEKGFLARAGWNLRLKSYVAVAMHGGWKMLWLLLSFLFAVVPFGAMLYWMPSTAGDATATTTGEHIWAVWIAKSAGLFATLLLVYKSCAEQVKALWAAPRAKELLTYLKMPSYAKHLGEIPEMRKTLETFCDVRLNQMTESKLEGGHTRLLLVVDDLDRCSHQGIVKVFEAVRLVLEIEYVTVIIAVDQHIALAALALHYKELAAHHKLASPRAIARDYLAKVIHLPITLSSPDENGVKKLLQDIWANTEGAAKNQTDSASADAQLLNTPETGFEQESLVDGSALVEPESSTASKTNNQTANTQPESASVTQGSAPKRGATKKQDPAPAEVVKVKALSQDQKKAFFHWVKYFGLHNPRQLKRLNNTYSLILNAYTHYDKNALAVDSEFGRQHQQFAFPVLIALITIEYLNALDSADLRKFLRAQLRSSALGSSLNETLAKSGSPINADFVAFFSALSESVKMNLFNAIEPYVLPAIECDDEAVCRPITTAS